MPISATIPIISSPSFVNYDAGIDDDLLKLAFTILTIQLVQRSQILKVIRDEIAPERPIPEVLDIIARLPCRNLWTTNYDRLIERSFAAIGRPIDPVSSARDLSIRSRAGATRLFKMHGTVENLNDIVISTDDYELYRVNRGAFLTVLQAHMTSFSMLFVGLSFSDPNVRHVLAMIRESFSASPPEHFAIVRPPQRASYSSDDHFNAHLTQHKLWSEDLLRYGLRVVEVDSYDEVPALLREVERRIARDRVWVSGSWPVGTAGWSVDKLVLFIAFVVPGFVALKTYALLCPSGSRHAATEIVDAISFSSINYALLIWPILSIHIHDVRTTAPTVYAIFWVFVLLIAPMAWAGLFFKLRHTQFFQKSLPHPTAKPWDYLFAQRKPYWVIVTLKDGKKIGGRYDSKSFASSNPAPEQLYLEQAWHLSEAGGLERPRTDSAGILVLSADIESVELFQITTGASSEQNPAEPASSPAT